MYSYFENQELQPDGLSVDPFTICDPGSAAILSSMHQIFLLEHSGSENIELWQKQKTLNLLKYICNKSKFWQNRIPSQILNLTTFQMMPPLTREELRRQIESEGSIVQLKKSDFSSYPSTGSTGVPIKVFVLPQNGLYNSIRNLAYYFENKISLNGNKVHIGPPQSEQQLLNGTESFNPNSQWAGPISRIFKSGWLHKIRYQHDDEKLIRDIKERPFDYLVANSRYVEIILKNSGIETLKQQGVKLWIHTSDFRDPDVVTQCEDAGIRCVSTYSAAETGPIAFECIHSRGFYHVASSNVLVEEDASTTTEVDGVKLFQLLVTHLESFATPWIRYAVGDFGRVHDSCVCGFQGKTLSKIYGRGKHFLTHPTGRLIPFYISTRLFMSFLPFEDCRIYQAEKDCIQIDIVTPINIDNDTYRKLTSIIHKISAPEFRIIINRVDKIDWSNNPKKLFFVNYVK